MHSGAPALGDPPAGADGAHEGVVAAAGAPLEARAGGIPGLVTALFPLHVGPCPASRSSLCVVWLDLPWCFSACPEMMPLLQMGYMGRVCQGGRTLPWLLSQASLGTDVETSSPGVEVFLFSWPLPRLSQEVLQGIDILRVSGLYIWRQQSPDWVL